MNSKLFLTASAILLTSTFLSVHRISFLSHPSTSEFHSEEEIIPIVEAIGPESFAFDSTGDGPYTGVSDGRIIKWQQEKRRWIDFAVTSPERDGCEGPRGHEPMEHICGRPLGLQFNNRTRELYIADAYMGLLVVGPDGGLANKVATQAQGVGFGLTNALDIDLRGGVVYFTDSSSVYQRRNHISVILSGDKSGRLMKYDPRSKEITVLLRNLSFPNGVALSQNGSFILIADTTNCRILRFWLETSKAGVVEVFIQLPGFPDNIRRNEKGEFWVGIHSRKGKFFKWLLSHPWIGSSLVKLPFDITKLHSYMSEFISCGLGVKLNEDGVVLGLLGDENGDRWRSISEVYEREGQLWIGSIRMPFVGIQKIDS